MTLGEIIINRLSLDPCFIKAYYKEVICCFHDENGDVLECTDKIDALLENTGNFAIPDDNFMIDVIRTFSDIIVHIM